NFFPWTIKISPFMNNIGHELMADDYLSYLKFLVTE
ncbi:MAG: hypothetical protein RLZZ86_1255, partial [Cyanobacteriota bacterium]